MLTDCSVNPTFKLFNPPEITESFHPSKSVGRPEVLEKHWSSRTFSLFSSASFLGQSDPPPPTQPPPRDDVCWFSELQERESRPSEHHSRGGEPCSHPSCTLRAHRGEEGKLMLTTAGGVDHHSTKQYLIYSERNSNTWLYLQKLQICEQTS